MVAVDGSVATPPCYPKRSHPYVAVFPPFYLNFWEKPWHLTEPNSSLNIHVFPCLGTGRPKPRGHSFILAITPFKIHGIWGSLCQLLKVISCLPSMARTCMCVQCGNQEEMMLCTVAPPSLQPLSPYPASPGNHAWAYRHNCPAPLDV